MAWCLLGGTAAVVEVAVVLVVAVAEVAAAEVVLAEIAWLCRGVMDPWRGRS